MFRGKDIYLLYKQLSCFFNDVIIVKPRCSRNSSIESFIYCTGFNLQSVDAGIESIDKLLKEQIDLYFKHLFDENEHANIQFRAAFGRTFKELDPDRNYSLEEVKC